jgi:hypothetical protein
MRNTITLLFACAVICSAQITVPEGTKIRVRLEQTVSSATADTGQTLEFTVTDGVEVGGAVVIAQGARVTGTVTQAAERRRLGRSGKFDFSIDRVMAVDGKWIPLRYTVNKAKGEGRGITTGILTAGIAVVFWPAAPLGLLVKGKDVTVNKGTIYEVFTDQKVTVGGVVAGPAKAMPSEPNPAIPAPPAPVPDPASTATVPGAAATIPVSYPTPGSLPSPVMADSVATVTITSARAGSEIEVDGSFVGSTPSTIKLAAGTHQVNVTSGTRIWTRTLHVIARSSITLAADLDAGISVDVQRSTVRLGRGDQ